MGSNMVKINVWEMNAVLTVTISTAVKTNIRAQRHCNKKQCEKPFGRNHHEQHCAKNRNGEDRRGINYNKQNKQHNMRNGNRRKEFIVDNKVSYSAVVFGIHFFFVDQPNWSVVGLPAKLYTNIFGEIVNALSVECVI